MEETLTNQFAFQSGFNRKASASLSIVFIICYCSIVLWLIGEEELVRAVYTAGSYSPEWNQVLLFSDIVVLAPVHKENLYT